jgi:hypothetical protein
VYGDWVKWFNTTGRQEALTGWASSNEGADVCLHIGPVEIASYAFDGAICSAMSGFVVL